MPNSPYPLFLGPAEFFATPPTTWTKAQGIEYFRWILQVKQSRVQHLLTFLDVEISANPVRIMLEVGHKFRAIMQSRDFFEIANGRNQPNAAGSALAADVGLLVGNTLVNRHESILNWELFTKTKRDIDYNQPVVNGWRYSPSQNFIRFGIVQAHNFAQGEGDADILAKQFYSLDVQASEQIVILVTERFEPKTNFIERAYIQKSIPFRKVDWHDTILRFENEVHIKPFNHN